MNWSKETRETSENLIKQLQLPDSFKEIVRDIYMPLAEIIMQKKQQHPLLVSINGAQGTGKSTLTLFIKHILQQQLECKVAALSLDDFYKTRAERVTLAEEIHPLLITRGVPGTHDLDLLENTIHRLRKQQQCNSPKFDKACDDRCDESKWTHYNEPVEVILFEGWCNNSPAQSPQELKQAVNQLETIEDPDGIWRDYANQQLKQYHQKIFNQVDLCIMLKAPDFEHIYEWRSLQEQKLRQNTDNAASTHIMNETELKRFIQHYERISRHTLKYLPEIADVVIPINSDHSINNIIQRHDK